MEKEMSILLNQKRRFSKSHQSRNFSSQSQFRIQSPSRHSADFDCMTSSSSSVSSSISPPKSKLGVSVALSLSLSLSLSGYETANLSFCALLLLSVAPYAAADKWVIETRPRGHEMAELNRKRSVKSRMGQCCLGQPLFSMPSLSVDVHPAIETNLQVQCDKE